MELTRRETLALGLGAAVLAVVLGVALKVISNYTNHVAETPVNEAFQKHAWTPKTKLEALPA